MERSGWRAGPSSGNASDMSRGSSPLLPLPLPPLWLFVCVRSKALAWRRGAEHKATVVGEGEGLAIVLGALRRARSGEHRPRRAGTPACDRESGGRATDHEMSSIYRDTPWAPPWRRGRRMGGSSPPAAPAPGTCSAGCRAAHRRPHRRGRRRRSLRLMAARARARMCADPAEKPRPPATHEHICSSLARLIRALEAAFVEPASRKA